VYFQLTGYRPRLKGKYMALNVFLKIGKAAFHSKNVLPESLLWLFLVVELGIYYQKMTGRIDSSFSSVNWSFDNVDLLLFNRSFINAGSSLSRFNRSFVDVGPAPHFFTDHSTMSFLPCFLIVHSSMLVPAPRFLTDHSTLIGTWTEEENVEYKTGFPSLQLVENVAQNRYVHMGTCTLGYTVLIWSNI
jgi:hypothetical protein